MDGTVSPKRSGVELLKETSHGLRGRLAEELAEGGLQVSEDGYNLLKFHGSYEQFDRDTATARKQQKLEKEYSFMLRVRMPGGRMTAAQYLALDGLADEYSNGTLRITTRQAIQFHGIIKGNLKPTIAAINRTLLTTQAACGDVVRNVTTTPAPIRDAVHARLEADANFLSHALLPKTHAYHEIFLDEAARADLGTEAEEEPLYGETYLPRKFKIGIATPSDNTIDVLTNDLGIIPIFEGDTLLGYNMAVGGGLGMTHNKPETYPRLGTVIGSVGPDELLAGVEAVIRLQRDYGDRFNRRRARLKYVVDDRGVDWVKAELVTYFGKPFAEPLPMEPFRMPELLGWHEQGDGRLWLGIPVPSGRIADTDGVRLRRAIREIVQTYQVNVTMTGQQDLFLVDVDPAHRSAIETHLREAGVTLTEDLTPLARWTLACPALPTCGLALTEAERVRDPMVAGLEQVLDRHGLKNERISLRITGCPNGCARTYAGDIGLVGRMPGHYAIYVGGDFEGTRLSFRLLDRIKEEQIEPTLDRLFAAFARDRQAEEGFGDFCTRVGAEALLQLLPAGHA
ncbi:NADPH-dependent assimilatory sulfite reductase hemoprotein subunit [Granulibacter bethesdensis]|uniref:Sulfite reductase (Ferredoxin) n=1 Tax=Granulibacter bethesdensis (strain ATCC BAA-1260 / CGDNIH1) TaxID=391165 RepID=Q0BTP5_GRABC|nr:NADPH-dependent assimilatory sulfite reductase hemoprotein subunit [Granulibacter bethesdensis]ABI61807.1 Sulfite reductase (Ferredoxin) [Granulibacter bethesdensis CGDNIH1]AHJ66698.1 Sulfite reductase (Ferredoxin) [Granulibacter bethesdensis CGDNIH4]AHJ69311.1 Sulfite reductase (Ferredoxin) [Granulibacter bethesdensis]APH51618.1 Sulfite reductase (Ferredoxin) [Granulibacter bethesdensis]APH59240.1 Sulfite reductase (Ferredoxin) [Granulibacter bethesdensis]